jgi:hypothetical protein
MIGLEPSTQLTSCHRLCYGDGRDAVTNPRFTTKLTGVAQARCPNAMSRACDKGGQSDFFGSKFKKPHGIANLHTTSYEAIMLHPTQASREVTPSSDKEAPSNIAAHCSQEGVKGSNKRCKQCLQTHSQYHIGALAI